MALWIKLLHILGVLAFALAHGASASMAFRLRHEKSLERIGAMLDLSTTYLGIVYAAIGVLLVAGIAAGFAGHWWGQGWIWLSLGLLLAMATAMSLLGTAYYHRIRKAVGLPYMENWKPQPATTPAGEAGIEALLARKRPVLLALIGGGGLAIVVGLMVFKPF
jgi:hypothetical protein